MHGITFPSPKRARVTTFFRESCMMRENEKWNGWLFVVNRLNEKGTKTVDVFFL